MNVNLGQVTIIAFCLVVAMKPAQSFELGGKTPTQAFPGIDGALVQAAVDGNTTVMADLVKRGADPNAKGYEQLTPLIWAISAHSHSGIGKLLELGADPNASNSDFGSPTWLAANGNDTESLKILLEHGGNPNVAFDCKTALIGAVRLIDRARIDLLLLHGADINSETCDETAPQSAAALGQFDLVLYFLSKGYSRNLDRLAWYVADRHVKEDSDAFRDKMKAIELLRARGAKIPPIN